jgi:hypothetical protein
LTLASTARWEDEVAHTESSILTAKVNALFQTIQPHSEPKQIPLYRPLPEVIKVWPRGSTRCCHAR